MRAGRLVRGLTLLAALTAVSCSIGPNFRNSWEKFAEVSRPHVANDKPPGPGEMIFSQISSSLDPMLHGQSIRWTATVPNDVQYDGKGFRVDVTPQSFQFKDGEKTFVSNIFVLPKSDALEAWKKIRPGTAITLSATLKKPFYRVGGSTGSGVVWIQVFDAKPLL